MAQHDPESQVPPAQVEASVGSALYVQAPATSRRASFWPRLVHSWSSGNASAPSTRGQVTAAVFGTSQYGWSTPLLDHRPLPLPVFDVFFLGSRTTILIRLAFRVVYYFFFLSIIVKWGYISAWIIAILLLLQMCGMRTLRGHRVPSAMQIINYEFHLSVLVSSLSAISTELIVVARSDDHKVGLPVSSNCVGLVVCVLNVGRSRHIRAKLSECLEKKATADSDACKRLKYYEPWL